MSIDASQYQPGDVVNGHQLSADGTEWVPVEQAGAAEAGQPNWFVRHKILTTAGVLSAGVVLLAAMSGGAETSTGSSDERQAVAAADAVEDSVTVAAPEPAEDQADRAEEPVAAQAEPPVEAVPDMTPSQRNALRSAEDYLSFTAFSEQGLIDQLSSEYGDQFSVEDATWAVGQLDVDWNEQAVRSAESYLELSGFSRAGLIDQLSSPSGEQFTVAQATYAADALGL